MYLLTLTGQGDVEFKLVGPLTWDWIFSPCPSSDIEIIPPAVQAEIIPHLEPGETLYPEIGITNTSWDNDRALAVPSKTFISVKDLVQYITSNNIAIIDEWYGSIY